MTTHNIYFLWRTGENHPRILIKAPKLILWETLPFEHKHNPILQFMMNTHTCHSMILKVTTIYCLDGETFRGVRMRSNIKQQMKKQLRWSMAFELQVQNIILSINVEVFWWTWNQCKIGQKIFHLLRLSWEMSEYQTVTFHELRDVAASSFTIGTKFQEVLNFNESIWMHFCPSLSVFCYCSDNGMKSFNHDLWLYHYHTFYLLEMWQGYRGCFCKTQKSKYF